MIHPSCISSVSRAARRSTRKIAKVVPAVRPSDLTKWASADRKPEGPGEFGANPSGFGSDVLPVYPSPNPSTLPQIPAGRTMQPGWSMVQC